MASAHKGGGGVGSDDGVYRELWRACAGPLVDVPHHGDHVFYFPQGHIQQLQLEASVDKQLISQQIPKFNLPFKILCTVLDTSLLADPETDEVYAQITLHPVQEQFETPSPDTPPPKGPKPVIQSFCKILTNSDTSTHGGFSVLRKHAEECLPPLDMSQQVPNQDLIAKDLHGQEWHFKHVYRGQPRRHLLTTGWSTFVTSKKLVAGDAFIFLRGPNGESRVGIRRLGQQQQTPLAASVISSQSMHLGILASASHALSYNTRFVVYYKPRYTGTIVEDADMSPEWPGSDWRSLKVRWDEPSTIKRPERVSPWEVEPVVAVDSFNLALHPSKIKRSKISDLQSSGIAGPFLHQGSKTSSEVSHLSNSSRPQTDAILPGSLTLLKSTAVQADKGKKPEKSNECRLFGYDLKNDSNVVSTGGSKCQIHGQKKEMKMEQDHDHTASSRTRTKVHMQGYAVGRAIELSLLGGYEELKKELEKMFEMEGGELGDRNKWEVVYTDDEGDMMLVGDDPWQEFCQIVRKIFIYASEDMKKKGSGSKVPLSSSLEDDGLMGTPKPEA